MDKLSPDHLGHSQGHISGHALMVDNSNNRSGEFQGHQHDSIASGSMGDRSEDGHVESKHQQPSHNNLPTSASPSVGSAVEFNQSGDPNSANAFAIDPALGPPGSRSHRSSSVTTAAAVAVAAAAAAATTANGISVGVDSEEKSNSSPSTATSPSVGSYENISHQQAQRQHQQIHEQNAQHIVVTAAAVAAGVHIPQHQQQEQLHQQSQHQQEQEHQHPHQERQDQHQQQHEQQEHEQQNQQQHQSHQQDQQQQHQQHQQLQQQQQQLQQQQLQQQQLHHHQQQQHHHHNPHLHSPYGLSHSMVTQVTSNGGSVPISHHPPGYSNLDMLHGHFSTQQQQQQQLQQHQHLQQQHLQQQHQQQQLQRQQQLEEEQQQRQIQQRQQQLRQQQHSQQQKQSHGSQKSQFRKPHYGAQMGSPRNATGPLVMSPDHVQHYQHVDTTTVVEPQANMRPPAPVALVPIASSDLTISNTRKRKASTLRSSQETEDELKRIAHSYMDTSLGTLSERVRESELTPNSERSRQIYGMAWLMRNCEGLTDAAVPRNRIYARYVSICSEYVLKPLNPASFGKLVRMIFPDIKTRRLGVRGQSKYYYCGIRLIGEQNNPSGGTPTGTPSRFDASPDPIKTDNDHFSPGQSGNSSFGNEACTPSSPFSTSSSSRPSIVNNASNATSNNAATNSISANNSNNRDIHIAGTKSNIASNDHNSNRFLSGSPLNELSEAKISANLIDELSSAASSGNVSNGGTGNKNNHYCNNITSRAIPDLRFASNLSNVSLSINIKESFLLPPLSDYLEEQVDPDTLETLTGLYKTHCLSLIDALRFMHVKKFLHLLTSFHGCLTAPVRRLLKLESILPWILSVDWAMYKEMVNMLSPLALQEIPLNVLNGLKSLSQYLPGQIKTTFANMPQYFIDTKLKPAQAFASLLDRLTRVSELAVNAGKLLANPPDRDLMKNDWIKFVDSKMIIEREVACGDEKLRKILDEDVVELLALSDVPKSGSNTIDRNEQKDSDDTNNGHGESSTTSISSGATSVDGSGSSVSASVFDGTTPKSEYIIVQWAEYLSALPARFPKVSARVFLLYMNAVFTAGLREIFLNGGGGFGAWMVVRCWVDEWMGWNAERGGFLSVDDELLVKFLRNNSKVSDSGANGGFTQSNSGKNHTTSHQQEDDEMDTCDDNNHEQLLLQQQQLQQQQLQQQQQEEQRQHHQELQRQQLQRQELRRQQEHQLQQGHQHQQDRHPQHQHQQGDERLQQQQLQQPEHHEHGQQHQDLHQHEQHLQHFHSQDLQQQPHEHDLTQRENFIKKESVEGDDSMASTSKNEAVGLNQKDINSEVGGENCINIDDNRGNNDSDGDSAMLDTFSADLSSMDVSQLEKSGDCASTAASAADKILADHENSQNINDNGSIVLNNSSASYHDNESSLINEAVDVNTDVANEVDVDVSAANINDDVSVDVDVGLTHMDNNDEDGDEDDDENSLATAATIAAVAAANMITSSVGDL